MQDPSEVRLQDPIGFGPSPKRQRGEKSKAIARNGVARQQYGERSRRRPGTILRLTTGQAVKDVVFVRPGEFLFRITRTSGFVRLRGRICAHAPEKDRV